MESVRIISANVRGLSNSNKRDQFLIIIVKDLILFVFRKLTVKNVMKKFGGQSGEVKSSFHMGKKTQKESVYL